MGKLMITIHNTETNEITNREMTLDELQNYEANEAAQAIITNKANEAATAKAALLKRLGITADEAALLLG
jgi:hypothetical protein